MSNDFEAALRAHREKPCLSVVVLRTLPENAKDPSELQILKVVGYCLSQQAALDYCDRENAVFKPSKGGVNPYVVEVLQELT